MKTSLYLLRFFKNVKMYQKIRRKMNFNFFYEHSSFAGASGACPAPGGGKAPANVLDPAPGGAFAPAKFFDPAPGGAFAPAKFYYPGPAGGGALPGPTPDPGIPCLKHLV